MRGLWEIRFESAPVVEEIGADNSRGQSVSSLVPAPAVRPGAGNARLEKVALKRVHQIDHLKADLLSKRSDRLVGFRVVP